MSKKQFDHIESKIREAAENSEPLYDATAWAAMEARLDKKHKRRYRVVVWLLPILLLVATGSISLLWETGRYRQPAMTLPPGSRVKSLHEKGTPNTRAEVNNIDPGINKKTSVISETGVQNSSRMQQHLPGKSQHHLNGIVTGTPSFSYSPNSRSTVTVSLPGTIEGLDSTRMHTGAENSPHPLLLYPIPGDPQPMKVLPARIGGITVSPVNQLPTITRQRVQANRFKQARFYFLVAIGAEVTGVSWSSFNNNPLTMKVGVGVGYQLSNRISLQTGFYQGKKKYVAGPLDYTAKPGSYYSMVDMQKIDASCMVFDIPITLRYNIASKRSVQYYATAGISSFIMKKESYDYYYQRYNLPYASSRDYTGNSHLLSVVNVSAGVEKKLSGTLSLLAEPSVSVPINGVGEGTVKLHGASLQLGLKYQPQKRKR